MKRKHPVTETAEATYACPSCFQAVDTFPDPGGGGNQTYVEDCPLCCRPNVLTASWDEALGAWTIAASRES